MKSSRQLIIEKIIEPADLGSIWLVSGLIVVQLGGSYVNIISYFALTVLALRSSVWAIKTLSLLVVLIFLNPALFHANPFAMSLRWIVLFSCCVRILFDSSKKTIKLKVWNFYFILYIFLAFVSSFLYSNFPEISYIKLLIFGLIFFLIDLGFQLCNKYDFAGWFYSIYIVLLILSMPLIFHPIGYVVNGLGFQGILSHPNGYGIYMVCFVAWLLSVNLFKKKDRSRFNFVATSVGLMTVLLTQSRTSMLAMCVSGVIFGLTTVFRKSNRESQLLIRVFFGGVLTLTVVYVYMELNPDNNVQKTVKNYILKNTSKSNLVNGQKIKNSRAEVIETSMQGFKKSPFFGNGFAVSSDPKKFMHSRDKVTGLPIAGSAEKGVIFTAILEETGIFGLLAFTCFIVKMSIPFLRSKKSGFLLIPFYTVVLINGGEVVFFSPGGLGLQVYLFLGFMRNQLFICRAYSDDKVAS